MTVLRDFALILLTAEAFVLALVPLVLLGGLVYGSWWLRRHENLPSWLRLAQSYVALGQAYVELAMAAIVRPILLVNSILATVRRWVGASAEVGGSDR
jgi:hypothetical protein